MPDANPDNTGLIYRRELKLGALEYGWADLLREQERRTAVLGAMASPGLVIGRTPSGELDDNWRVHDDDDDGSVSVEVAADESSATTALLVTNEGDLVALDLDQSDILTVPNDDTWYTIVAQAVVTQNEPGTLGVNIGSNVVTGTLTKFTTLDGATSSSFGRGSKIRIFGSAGGNNGTYEVDSIASDTSLTLTSNVLGNTESGLSFSIAGDYFNVTPVDPDIHRFQRISLTRVALVREPAANVFPLADVKRNDAAGPPKVQIIDRRHQRLYRSTVLEAGKGPVGTVLRVRDLHQVSTGGVLSLGTRPRLGYVTGTGGFGAEDSAIAPADTAGSTGHNNLLVAVEKAGVIDFFSLNDGNVPSPGDPTFGGTGAASVTGVDPALVRMPPGSGLTHLLFYMRVDRIYVRSSDDDGDTWGAEVLVIDPTAVDPLDTAANPAAIRLINGRLLVVFEYYDDSAGVRYISSATSDDLGATWDDDAGQGYEVYTSGIGDVVEPDVAQAADGRIAVVFSEAISPAIEVIFSKDLSGHFTTPASQFGSAFLTSGYFDRVDAPLCWWSPDGMLVVAYQAYRNAATLSSLCYAIVGMHGAGPLLLGQQAFVKVDDNMAAYVNAGHSWCQDNDGGLVYCFRGTFAGAPDDQHTLWLDPVGLPLQEGSNGRYRSW